MTEHTSTVSVMRATYYTHEEEVWPAESDPDHPADSGIRELAITALAVDIDVVEAGQITISARGPDPLDAYGFEFDLDPEGAERLARLLLEAARSCGGSRPPAPGDR